MSNKRITYEEVNKKMEEIDKKNPYSNILQSMHDDIIEFENRKGKSFQDTTIRVYSDYTSGTIDFDSLNSVLQGLQDLSISAFNDKFGSRVENGKIPIEILNQSKLILTGVGAGSFIINFDSIENKKLRKQLSLFPEEEKNAVEVLSAVVKEIANIDESNKATKFVENYGKRTYKHTLKWFEEIRKKEIYFEYNDVDSFESIQFDESRVEKISTSLKTIRKEVLIRNEKISGSLVAVNNKNGTLIIEDENEILIKIKVRDDSLNNINMVTNQKYSLKVEIHSQFTTIDENDKKETYYLDTVQGLGK